MSAKKSKNNPDTRGGSNVEICPTCNEPKQWTAFAVKGSNKMCLSCKCGVFNKNGVKVLDWKQ